MEAEGRKANRLAPVGDLVHLLSLDLTHSIVADPGRAHRSD
jgi:hypothetical protein